MRPEKRGKTSHKKTGRGAKTVHEKSSTQRQGDDVEAQKESHYDQMREEREPSFRRRKIESNWEKYEMKEADETAPDYREFIGRVNVIAMSSHFTYDQSEAVNVSCDTDTANDMSTFLSLNCNDLSQALRAIPFYKRLRIDDTSIFTDGQMADMDSDAAFHMKNYTITHGLNDETNNVLNETLIQKLVSQDHSVIDASRERRSSTELYDLDIHKTGSVSPVSSDTRVNNGTNNRYDKSNTSPQTKVVEDLKDDSRDSSGGKYNQYMDTNDVIGQEDELDMLLSMTTPIVCSDKKGGLGDNEDISVKSSHEPKPPISMAKETTADLEDWLDGVLDDV